MRAARCDTLRRAPQNNLPVRTLFRGRRFHCGSKADGPCVHLGRHLLGPRTENCSSNLVRVGPLGGVPARPLVCCDRAGAKQLPAAATRPCGCRIAAHAACLAATAAGRTHAAPIAAELRRLTVHFAMHACMPGPGSVFAARPGRVAAKRRSPQAALTAVAGHHSLRAVPRCGLRRRGRGSPAGADQPGCARPLLPRRRGRRRSPPHGQCWGYRPGATAERRVAPRKTTGHAPHTSPRELVHPEQHLPRPNKLLRGVLHRRSPSAQLRRSPSAQLCMRARLAQENAARRSQQM